MIYSVSLQQQCKLKCTKKGKTRNTGKWSIEVYILNITFLIKKKKKTTHTKKCKLIISSPVYSGKGCSHEFRTLR